MSLVTAASARLDERARGLSVRLAMQVEEPEADWSYGEFDKTFFLPIPEWTTDFRLEPVKSFKHRDPKWGSPWMAGSHIIEPNKRGWRQLQFRISRPGNDRTFAGIVASIQQSVWVETQLGRIQPE